MKVGILIKIDEYPSPYEAIAHNAKLGFDNAQLSMWDMSLYNDDTVAEIKRACEEFNMTITAVWCGWSGPVVWPYPNGYLTLGLVPAEYRAQRIQEILKGADFAHALGVKDIITHIGFLPDNPFDRDHLGVVQALRYICTKLKARDQYFLFETGEELPLSLVYLFNDVGADNLGINFDPANFILNGRGSHPVTTLKFLGRYVRGFHAKDALQLVPPECKKVEKPIGQGDVDFPGLIAVLREYGYDGALTIERENYGDPSRDAEITAGKAYLEALL